MFLCYLARAWRCPKKKVHSLKETKSLERCWHCIKNKVRFRGRQSLGSAGDEKMPLALAQEVAEQGLGDQSVKTGSCSAVKGNGAKQNLCCVKR